MLIGKQNRFAMATCQLFRFSLPSIAINRTYSMDDVLCAKPATGCNHSLSSGQPSDLAHNLPAFGEYCGTAGAVNRAIDSASAQKR